MPALDAIADWPVPTAAAAVIGPSGVLSEHGDVAHRFGRASVTKPLVDIKASSNLEDNIGVPLAAYNYAVSTMHCMSVSLGLDGDGLGTVWAGSSRSRCSPTPASARCLSARSSPTRSTTTTSPESRCEP